MQPSQKSLFPKQPNRGLIEGMRVLQHVMNNPEPSRVVDIARNLNLEQTRAHRLLRTLTALGYLRHIQGRRYIGGPAVPILASQAMHSSGFVQHVYPVLLDLLKQSKLLVAYGLFWERTVTYLFHARPGSKIEKAIGGHEVLPATRSRIGLAVLSKMDESEVDALYQGHDIAPFDSLEDLHKKLRSYREAGFAYDCGFASDPGEENSLALTVPDNPYIALSLGGDIPREDIPKRLAELKEALSKISLQATHLSEQTRK
ncbi:IclR family transcriptional regulator [Coraliomargarita sp. W4R72]